MFRRGDKNDTANRRETFCGAINAEASQGNPQARSPHGFPLKNHFLKFALDGCGRFIWKLRYNLRVCVPGDSGPLPIILFSPKRKAMTGRPGRPGWLGHADATKRPEDTTGAQAL
jgi:hypothetical protein